jgi:hypothetical protein
MRAVGIITLLGLLWLLCSSALAHPLYESSSKWTQADGQSLVRDANIAAAANLFGPSLQPGGQPNLEAIGKKSIFAFSLRWPIGSRLHVCMWQPDQKLRALIAAVATEWLADHPNIQLDFGNPADPRICSNGSTDDIRVADDPASPLSPFLSDYGTQARREPLGAATMNLGFGGPGGAIAAPALDAAAHHNTAFRNYFHFVVLHEFGHALGALHEHQWGTCVKYLNNGNPAVIQILFPTATTPLLQQEAWANLEALNKSDIDEWGVVKLTKTEDPNSVMRYDFPPEIYKAGAPDYCTNRFIKRASKGDLAGLRSAYPQPGDPAPLGSPALLKTASALANPGSGLTDGARDQSEVTVSSVTRILATSPHRALAPAPRPATSAEPTAPVTIPTRVLDVLNALASPNVHP